MNSIWISLAPFLVLFGWMMARQQFGTTCPHCGGELAGTVGRKPKAVDDELAGRRAGFGSRHRMIFSLTPTVLFAVAISLFFLFTTRAIRQPILIPPPMATPPLPVIQAAPLLPLPPPRPPVRLLGKRP